MCAQMRFPGPEFCPSPDPVNPCFHSWIPVYISIASPGLLATPILAGVSVGSRGGFTPSYGEVNSPLRIHPETLPARK